MAKRDEPTTTHATDGGPSVHIASETSSQAPIIKGSIDDFIKRREEVAAADHEEFRTYLVEKQQLEAAKRQAVATVAEQPRPSGFNRRRILGAVAGTAAAAEAGVIAYNVLGNGAGSDSAVQQAGGVATGPQGSRITREVVDSRADMRGQSLGNWVALLPTKMGGGT